MSYKLSLTTAICAAGVLAMPAAADEIADFYQGKTLTMMVTSGVGGGYDAFARTLARHMPKHIPGNPGFITNNRVGAGGLVGANYLYTTAPQDGTILSAMNRAVPTQPLFGHKGARFDATKMHWLGSLNNSVSVCVSWNDQKVKTLGDIFKEPLIVGAQNNTDMTTFPILMNNLFGTKFNVIGGYSSGTQANLAMERGEVQGRCGWSWASVTATRGHWIKDKTVNFLVQIALKKHKALPDLPIITDLVKNERDRKVVELILARQEYGRPFVMGPGVPKARVEAMRKAFMATSEDPAFRAEIVRQKLELNAYDGWDMQKTIEKLYQTPKEVVAYAVQMQKKGLNRIKQIKVTFVKHSGKVVGLERGGRRIVLDMAGKKVKAKVSGSRTAITVNGEKAKRKAVKVGMNCTVNYPGPGEEAKNVDCKS
mgnify:CR=1 FL=1